MTSSSEHTPQPSTAEHEVNIVQPITRTRRTQNELQNSDYKHRLSAFEEKRLCRQKTICQLKEETKHTNISLIQPQISDTVNIIKTHDPLDATEWQKYLISIHNDLSDKVPYFQSVNKQMNCDAPECDIEDGDDTPPPPPPPMIDPQPPTPIYTMERTLMQQMKYWIERYGVPAMVAHQEVYKLKKDLINAIEEADSLEEESVQLIQNVFERENEIQILKNKQIELYKKINELNGEKIYLMKRKCDKCDSENGDDIPPPPMIDPPNEQHKLYKKINELNINEIYKIKQKCDSENGDDIPPPPMIYPQPPTPINKRPLPQIPPILTRSCNNLIVQK